MNPLEDVIPSQYNHFAAGPEKSLYGNDTTKTQLDVAAYQRKLSVMCKFLGTISYLWPLVAIQLHVSIKLAS